MIHPAFLWASASAAPTDRLLANFTHCLIKLAPLWYHGGVSMYYKKSLLPFMALFFSLSVILSTSALMTAGKTGHILSTGILLLCMDYLFYMIILHCRAEDFSWILLTFGLLIIGITIAAAVVLDLDLLRSAFHQAGQLYMISLYRKKELYTDNSSKSGSRTMILVAFLIILASVFWMFILGYQIIFNHIPGASAWMLFNLYSILNILIAIDAFMYLQNSLYTHVDLKTDRLRIDSKDLSPLLAANDIQLLYLFAEQKNHTLTCSLALQKLNNSNNTIVDSCRHCLDEHRKATLCSDYKRIYNQILKLKRFLETMKIATILPPDNKMQITRLGWTLHLFEDVHLHLNK